MIDLKEFRESNGLTQTQAAEYFGCKQSFISGIERGTERIPDSFIRKLKAETSLIIHFIDSNRGLDGNRSVPFWNLPVTAGRSIMEVIGQTQPDGYVSGLPGTDLAENILPVTGTSMEPEVPEGALIGVRKMEKWETLNTGRIYLIITHDDRMIKRIEHDAENEAILWCTSPNYKKFKIYKSDIIEIHRVCFVYNVK